MTLRYVAQYFIAGEIALALAACGGGGGGGTPPPEVEKPQTVIYQQNVGGQDDLYAIKEDGSGHLALSKDSIKFDDFEAMAPGDVVILSRFEQAGGNQFNRDIYAVNLNGSVLIPLANSASEDIFRGVTNSGRVIYRSAGRLYSINADGTDVKELVNSLGAFLQFQAITNDNQVIYTLSGTTYIMPADKSVIPAVTLTDVTSHDYVRQAPDGRVIFRSSGILYSVRPDGSDRQDLNPQAGTSVWVAAFSSTGRVIYSDHVNNNDYNLFSVNTDGTGYAALGITANNERFKTITPNDHVIYQMTNNLYAIKADGSGPLTKLTNTDLKISFVRSTSTNKIIYTRDPANGNQHYDIYIVDLDGNNDKPLATDPAAFLSGAGFTADGRYIYSHNAGKGPTISDLYLVDTDGNNRVTLADNPDLGESFWWTSNSDRIIYLAYDGVDSEIYSINTDGSDRKVLTSSGGIKRRVYLH